MKQINFQSNNKKAPTKIYSDSRSIFYGGSFLMNNNQREERFSIFLFSLDRQKSIDTQTYPDPHVHKPTNLFRPFLYNF